MDKLDKIFELQKKFDEDVKRNRGLENVSKEEWLQKETLAMLSEMAELLGEINWKLWKNPNEVNSSKVKEELVDILHFFVGMCLNADMTADELFEIYISKNEENFKRQYGKSLKEGYSLKDFKKDV